jgi:hypothetical protein
VEDLSQIVDGSVEGIKITHHIDFFLNVKNIEEPSGGHGKLFKKRTILGGGVKVNFFEKRAFFRVGHGGSSYFRGVNFFLKRTFFFKNVPISVGLTVF